MDPLDPGVGVVERRDQLAMAQRPVGAAHPGVGHPHDHPDRDEQDRRDDRGEGGLLEAGHGRCGRTSGTRARARRGGVASRPILRTTVRGRRRAIPASRGRLRLRSVHAPIPRPRGRPARARPSPCWPPRARPAPTPLALRRRRAVGDPVHPRRAGEGAVPVRLLVPRRGDQPARRRPRPQGLGGVPRAGGLGRCDGATPRRSCGRSRARSASTTSTPSSRRPATGRRPS